MRLFDGLALAGLSGLAAAATNEPAHVYILSQSPSSSLSPSIPQIPRQVARDILVQRVGGVAQLSDLPNSITQDQALSYIAQYGSAPKPLFGSPASEIPPSQLVVVLEGAEEEGIKSLKDGLEKEGFAASFAVPDAPSAKATEHLIDVELADISADCNMAAVVSPYGACWKGMSLATRFDIGKYPSTLETLIESLPSITKHIASGALEAAIVVLPGHTRSSKHAHWTTNPPAELRRRLSETPISDSKIVVAPGSGGQDSSSSAFSGLAADPSSKMNLGCFSSYNSCVSATGNCTGHGVCSDKYAIPGQKTPEGAKQCFVCSCLATKKYPDKENSKHTHWGGAYCQKIDVSSPFWLIFITTVVLIGLVTGCIVMLFSIGEEKLPGVIGAGVSRSK